MKKTCRADRRKKRVKPKAHALLPQQQGCDVTGGVGEESAV